MYLVGAVGTHLRVIPKPLVMAGSFLDVNAPLMGSLLTIYECRPQIAAIFGFFVFFFNPGRSHGHVSFADAPIKINCLGQ